MSGGMRKTKAELVRELDAVREGQVRFGTLLKAERALRESEERFRTLWNSVQVGALLIDKATHEIVDANDKAVEFFGGPKELLVGRTCHRKICEERCGACAAAERGGTVDQAECTFVKADGAGIPVLKTVAPIVLEGRELYLESFMDISDRRDAYRQAKRSAREATALLRGARAVLVGEDFQATARALFDMCREITGAKSGYVALLSDDGGENEVLFLEAGGMPCSVDPNLPMPIRGLRSEAYRTGEAVLDNDFANSEWMRFMPEGHVPLHNVMFAPLTIGGRVVGLMGLANKPGDFTDDDLRVGRAFGELAAIALKNSRAHEELTKSEERYRSIFDGAASVITSVNTEGIIVDCNERVGSLLGYDPQELIGQPMSRIIHPDSLPKAEENLKIILANGSLHEQEYRMVARDGRAIDVCINSSALREGNGSYHRTICIIDDITQRKRAEEALRRAHLRLKENERRLRDSNEELRTSREALEESEEWYRGLLEGSADGILVADCQTERLKFANPAWLAMLGYSPEELPELAVEDIHPTEELPRAREAFRAQAEGRIRLARDIPCLRKDGTVVYCDINAAPQRLDGVLCNVGFFRDVTARREAEARIRDLAKFPEENPHPVLRAGADGAILFANPAAGFLLEGWGVTVGGRLPPGWAELARSVLAARERREVEEESGGRVFSILIAPFVEAGYVNLYGRDITEVRRAEEERARIEEDYRQAQKMESIGQLAGGVAHDFNNVLGGIVGYADVLKMHLGGDAKHVELLTKITDAATRAANLTSQLLTFARKANVSMEPLDPDSVVAQAVDILRQTIDRRIEIAVRAGPAVAAVTGDRNQLVNALLNLGINARDAMPDGGKLTFETDEITLAAESLLPEGFLVSPGAYVKVSVTDTGRGMDERTRRRLFEPFFTTKERGKGTGLGLASVYGCVKQHEGYITVDSRPGEGAAFHLYLPARREGVVSEREEEAGGGSRGSGHILLVDDEEMIRETTREMLTDLGYEVTACADGVEALALFADRSRRIDAVLLDLIMPRMGGLQCYRSMREIDPSVPVVVTTGHGNSDEESRIVGEGADMFVRKPYGMEQISRALAEVLRHAPDREVG